MKAFIYEPKFFERTFPAKDGRPARAIFQQVAYFDLGGRFQVEGIVEIESLNHSYQPGEYELAASSYRVNQYGRLELNPYQIKLNLIKPALKAA